jgi:uroporphyrinogen decarboxylase
MMFSPAVFRKLIKPRMAKLIDLAKQFSEAKILFHSCGAISEILDDLIEIGVDAINPVQVSAEGM